MGHHYHFFSRDRVKIQCLKILRRTFWASVNIARKQLFRPKLTTRVKDWSNETLFIFVENGPRKNYFSVESVSLQKRFFIFQHFFETLHPIWFMFTTRTGWLLISHRSYVKERARQELRIKIVVKFTTDSKFWFEYAAVAFQHI